LNAYALGLLMFIGTPRYFLNDVSSFIKNGLHEISMLLLCIGREDYERLKHIYKFSQGHVKLLYYLVHH